MAYHYKGDLKKIREDFFNGVKNQKITIPMQWKRQRSKDTDLGIDWV